MNTVKYIEISKSLVIFFFTKNRHVCSEGIQKRIRYENYIYRGIIYKYSDATCADARVCSSFGTQVYVTHQRKRGERISNNEFLSTKTTPCCRFIMKLKIYFAAKIIWHASCLNAVMCRISCLIVYLVLSTFDRQQIPQNVNFSIKRRLFSSLVC